MKLTQAQLPDVTDFNYVPCKYGGRDCIWFYPHLEGVKWTQQNLIFRSSIWTADTYELVSPGLKKFFNWDQHLEIDPPPTDLKKAKIMEKLDGSCLVVSKLNGELIIRTRRANARAMLNGDEIDQFMVRYPDVFNSPLLDTHSLIFEWLTPTNRIVLRYDEPEIRLTAAIDHDTYSYATQKELDGYALNMGVKRPRVFDFDSVEALLLAQEDLQNEEGYCVYYSNDQKIRKVKSEWYVAVHNVRNGLTLKNVIELYFAAKCPDFKEFMGIALEQYKMEGMQDAMPFISTVHDGMKTVREIEAGMIRFVIGLEKPGAFKNRKEQADHIFSSYGKTDRAAMVFTILDGRALEPKQLKKLLYQCLAK